MNIQDWIYPEVAEDDIAHPSLFQEYERGENNLITARIHTEPVWLINPSGVRVRMPDVHYAERARQNDSTVMVSHTANSIEFHVKDNGTCIYRKGIYRARLRMKSRSLELLNGSDAASSDANYSEETLTEQDNVIHQHECWPGVSVSHTVSNGRIKEDITLSACPDLGDGRWLRIVWDMKLDNLVAVLDTDGSVSFLKPNGNPLFSFAAPTAWGADDKRVRCNYRINANGDLVLRVNAGDLATAQYPVTLDPTVTGTTVRARRVQSTQNIMQVACQLFTLPATSIPAASISSASFGHTKTKTGLPTETVDIWCAAGNDWAADATYAQMASDWGADHVSSFNNNLATGSYSYSVLGDATKGLYKVYADANGTPPRCTVKMQIASPDTYAYYNDLKIGDYNNSYYSTFTSPTLTIEYTNIVMGNYMNYYRQRRK